jgi:hypothetical protein
VYFIEKGVAKYCTKDNGTPTIVSQLSAYSIYRMWVNAYGALFLTNDGDVSNETLRYFSFSENGVAPYYFNNIYYDCVTVSGNYVYVVPSGNQGMVQKIELDMFYESAEPETIVDRSNVKIAYLASEGSYLYWGGSTYYGASTTWIATVGRFDISTGEGKGFLYLDGISSTGGYVTAINVYKNILYFATYDGVSTYKIRTLDTSKTVTSWSSDELYSQSELCYGINIDPTKSVISLYGEPNSTPTITRIDMTSGALKSQYPK